MTYIPNWIFRPSSPLAVGNFQHAQLRVRKQSRRVCLCSILSISSKGLLMEARAEANAFAFQSSRDETCLVLGAFWLIRAAA